MSTSEDEDCSRHYTLAIQALRKATTDTEKFGALFVVCNVLKGRPLSDDQNQELFKSIGTTFLCRLLSITDDQISKSVDNATEEQSADDSCPPYIYQTIGLSIVSAFFTRIGDSMNTKTIVELMSAIAPVLTQLQTSGKVLDDNERQMVTDIIVCHECVFSDDRVRQIDFKTMNRLFATKFTRVLLEMYSNDRFIEYKTQINELLLKIAMTIEWSDFDDKSFAHFMSIAAHDFNTTQDKRKFDLSLQLVAIIDTNHKYFASKPTDPTVSLISDTIFYVLRNKLNKELRDPIVKLAATLTELYNGFQWIYSSTNSWDKTNAKRFLLLLRLSCIEVSMNYESQDIDMSCVANSFVILEHAVLTVANDSEEFLLLSHLTQEEIYDMLTAIRDTMSVIIGYLQRFSADDCPEMDSESDAFVSVLASIRVLAVWVTEETEALREDIASVVPFIVKVLRKTYDNRLSIGKSILTAFVALADDPTLRQILLDQKLIPFLNTISNIKQQNSDLLLIENLKQVLLQTV